VLTAAFEPIVSASEKPQTQAFKGAATGTYITRSTVTADFKLLLCVRKTPLSNLDADTFCPDLRFLIDLSSVSTEIPE
jgi:hypothetical protein